jgi:hypothetical protein
LWCHKTNLKKIDPDNFRAITLISCLGKLFTSIFNTRLNICSNELGIISENQTGFRKGYSTQDNIFFYMHLLSYTFRLENIYFVHLLIFGKRSTRFGEQGCGKNYKEVKKRVNVLK